MLTDVEIMAQVLAAFQEEQAEHRQAAGELLLELERCPDHQQRQALVDQLFREAHSLKGGARAAGRSPSAGCAEVDDGAARLSPCGCRVVAGSPALTGLRPARGLRSG